MSRRRRIGFLTSLDARDRSSWSGSMYYMAQALQRHCGDVEYLGPVFAVREFLGRARSGLSLALHGRRRAYHHTLALSKEYARRFQPRMHPGLDLIVAPAGSTEIAALETRIPIVYSSDATIERLVDYHPGFTGLAPSYLAEAHEVERRALERATLVLYPSEWAADSARGFYGAPDSKIHVLPYGANLDRVPDSAEIPGAKSEEICRITFLGVNWERKGGSIVYSAVGLLRKRGIDARLVVCGSVPPEPLDPEYAQVIPRLDKQKPEEQRELSRLLLRSSFLVLPTRNDCYGIVFCEASAHGTPSIAPSTGGVPGAIRHGENGLLLPEDAGPEVYADAIASLFLDRPRYRTMVASSRKAYEERLNWDVWGQSMRELLDALSL